MLYDLLTCRIYKVDLIDIELRTECTKGRSEKKSSRNGETNGYWVTAI